MEALVVTRIILYVRDIPKVAAFYQRHFGLQPVPGDATGWLELDGGNGCNVALHQAPVSQKRGSEIKLVFGVSDVHGFKAAAALRGLKFGVVHDTGVIQFANAKDPAGNAIQISNRGLAR